MRADRLLSLLMLLQARGRMTARKLANELEVSERTIYRDIDALSAAGVPVYGEPGPEGGYALLDQYRTNLTGLTSSEVRALFMLNIPAPLADLGLSQELRAALRKLSAALSDTQRGDEERARQRFHFDSTWWLQDAGPVPHLQVVHQAVWQDRKLHFSYRPLAASTIERLVEPYGLVAKAGVWYLVYTGNSVMRVIRISKLLDARLDCESFQRRVDFDLAEFWAGWCAEQEAYLSHYIASVRVAPDLLPELPRHFGTMVHAKIEEASPPDVHGWLHLELTFESFEAARTQLLGFGRAVEVLAPRALRRSVLDFAEQILRSYTKADNLPHPDL